jgi:hypothetical protein
MYITVEDMLHVESLTSWKLIAGAGGLDRIVTNVGILDSEFDKRGTSFFTDEHFSLGDFILTTFLYAKNNSALILDAIKRLRSYKTSGIAIKNVYSLEISHEIIYYANKHNFPVFIFTDNSLFFETVIVSVYKYINTINDQNIIEKNISRLLNEESNITNIKKTALEINYSLSEKYQIAYFSLKAGIPRQKLNMFLRHDYGALGQGNSLAKYKNGAFYIQSIDSSKKQSSINILNDLKRRISVNADDYHIGISEPQYYFGNFKKGLLQSYYASIYNRIINTKSSHYSTIGVYRLLLPYSNQNEYNQYYYMIIAPIIEYDDKNNSNLLETALVYEECYGNINEVASRLSSHSNTIRYRIKKLAEIIGMDGSNGNFTEQLSLAIKLYRIKNAINNTNL